MASVNAVRKLVLNGSKLQILRPYSSSSRCEGRKRACRWLSSAPEQQLASAEDESQVQRRPGDALYGGRDSPFRMFGLMDPFFPTSNLRSMMDNIDRIFDDSLFAPSAFRDSPVRRRHLRTPWDLKETDDAFKMRLDVPGLSKEEVKVYIEEGALVIKAEHDDEKKAENDEWERHHRYFSRIQLPEDVNPQEVKAEVKNGVLHVTIPKVKEEERKKSVIDVPVN